MFCPPTVTASEAGRRPRAVTRRARHLAHVALDLLAHAVALGLRVTALEPRHHALELGRVRTLPPVPVAVTDVDRALARPVQHGLLVALAELAPRRVDGEAVLLRDRAEHPVEVLAPEPGPRRDRALGDAEVVVGDDQLRIDLEAGAEPVAALAGAVRRVEREVARRELLERQAAVRAGQMLREREHLPVLVVLLLALLRDDLDLGDALGEAQGGLERVGEPALDTRAANEPVDDDLDRVLLVPGQPLPTLCVPSRAAHARQLVHLAVDPRPGEALTGELGEQPLVLALPAPHDRRQHLEPGALGELEHPVDDLLRRLPGDDLPAVRAVRHADPGVQEPQVVVDLGDRAHRRPGVPRRRLLVDRDRGREALDEVDVGLVHLAEELPGVRRQRLDVPALPLGVDRVERERRLPRARQAGEDDQAVAGQLEVDVPEVVLARPRIVITSATASVYRGESSERTDVRGLPTGAGARHGSRSADSPGWASPPGGRPAARLAR